MSNPPFHSEQTNMGWRFVVQQRMTPKAASMGQRGMRVLGTPLAAALLPALYFVLFDAWVQANDISGALYGVGLSGFLIPLLIVGRIRSHWAPRMVPAQLEIQSNRLVIDAWVRRPPDRTLARWVAELPLHELSDGTDQPVKFDGPQKERFLSWKGTDGYHTIPHLQCTSANGKQIVSHLNFAIQEAKQRHGSGRAEVPQDLLNMGAQWRKTPEPGTGS